MFEKCIIADENVGFSKPPLVASEKRLLFKAIPTTPAPYLSNIFPMLRKNFLKAGSTRCLLAGLLDSCFLIKPDGDFLKRTLHVLRSSTLATTPTTRWGCIKRTVASTYSSKSNNNDTSPPFKTTRRPSSSSSSSHPSTNSKTHTSTVQVGPHTWHFETTSSPTTPSGAITVKIGDTMVLASVSTNLPPPPSSSPSPSLQNFNSRRRNQVHRLQVNYREPSYASSKIPPIYARREAVPTHQEMLQSRHIDRIIRHLFPSGLSYDTTANINILSTPSPTNTTNTSSSSSSLSTDVAGINAISAALTYSSGTIPWLGPIAAARVCLIPSPPGGEAMQSKKSMKTKTKKDQNVYKAVVNPDQATIGQSRVSVLVVVNAHGEVVSMQMQGEEVGEEEVELALERGIEEAGKLILPQLALVENNGIKQEVELSYGADAEASAVVHQLAGPHIATILSSTDTDNNSSSSSISTALYNAKLQLIEDLRRRGAWRTDFARTPGSGCVSPGDLDPAFTSAVHAELRKLIMHRGYRPPDGRGLDDVRRVSARLNFLPAPHGSALVSCSSKDAQALGVVTVGGRRDAAMINSSKSTLSVFGSTAATTSSYIADTSSSNSNYCRFTTYVATSPISTPDASSSNYRPNHREQLQQDAEHAAFLETALSPVLPCCTEFPFPMRVNVELLSSSSSSTMLSLLSTTSGDATTTPSCSSSSALIRSASLALASAGVPIKSLVAATTIGLVATDEERRWWCGEKRMYSINNKNIDDANDARSKDRSQVGYEMLTDMSSLESALSDIELTAAGTNQGLTAVQLNVKLAHGRGVGADVIKAALNRARKVHLDLLRDMEDSLRRQPNMKQPVLDYVFVNENALPAVVGVQGSKIQNLEDETGAKVWVDFKSPSPTPEVGAPSSSSVTTASPPSTPSSTTTTGSSSILVYAPSKAIFNAAKQGLLASSGDTLIEGRIYPAQVTMVKDFGAFVDVGPAQVRALLHISEISNERIRSVQDCLKVGQQLEVMALGRGSKGELRVSARKVAGGGHGRKEDNNYDGEEEVASSKKRTTA